MPHVHAGLGSLCGAGEHQRLRSASLGCVCLCGLGGVGGVVGVGWWVWVGGCGLVSWWVWVGGCGWVGVGE